MFLNCTENTYDFLCAACGETSVNLPIEQVAVSRDDLLVRCPVCQAHGRQSTEHFPHLHVARLAATMALRAKESLVGTVLDGGNIVTSDTRYELAAHTQEQVRHCLKLHQHPAIKAARRAAHLNDPLDPPKE